MAKTEKILYSLTRMDKGRQTVVPSVVMLILTILYLIAVLSVPLQMPQKLIWLAAYPIFLSELCGTGYLKIFLRSLWILPILIFIGIFNPFIDTAPAFTIGDVTVNRGCVSLFSILLRGLIAFQSVLILVSTAGIIETFNSLRKIGCPTVLVTQLQLTYRYIAVIIEESLTIKRACAARGFGKRSYPLKLWARLIGQLLVKSTHRATKIHLAMLARGFNGVLPTGNTTYWTTASWVWLLGGITFIAILRFTDFTSLLLHFTGNFNR